MKLDTTFYRLPMRFDAQRLAQELEQFGEPDWRPHPQGFVGNSALILVATDGDVNDDLTGSMQPTQALGKCPYMQQVMASFRSVIGRSRIMRLASGENVSEHTDIHHYWHHHIRIHVPIVTDPSIEFWCGGDQVHMAPGEAWVFDNWRMHKVLNPSGVTRTHLVIDTTASAWLWNLVRRSEQPFAPSGPQPQRELMVSVAYDPQARPDLRTERFAEASVMAPGEMDVLLQELVDDIQGEAAPDETAAFKRLLADLRADWRNLWGYYGDQTEGHGEFSRLLDDCLVRAGVAGDGLKLRSNGHGAMEVLRSRLSAACRAEQPRRSARRRARDRMQRPIIIVAAPRSGSTLLFETLAANRQLWTIGGESHAQFESQDALNPLRNGRLNNRLLAADASPEVVARLRAAFRRGLRNGDGKRLTELPAQSRPQSVRFLEKTPKNALRIPFLNAAFPDALFVFLHREPRANISSIMEAWRSGKFVTYPKLPGWEGPAWSLLLPPDWQTLKPDALADVAAYQWRVANQCILDDLAQLPAARWCAVDYGQLSTNTATVVRQVCEFADIPFGPRMQELTASKLPLSRYTLSAPDTEKWRKNEAEILPVLDSVQAVARQLGQLGVPSQANATLH